MIRMRCFLPFLLCLPFVFACKKKNSHGADSCRIIASYDSLFLPSGNETSSLRIFYDNDGRVAYTQSYTSNDSITRVFIYTDNSIVISPTNPLAPYDTIQLNNQGLAVRIKQSFIDYPYYSVLSYAYDPSGLLQSYGFLQTNNSGPAIDSTTTTYKFVNGDCVSSTANDGTVTNYSYYTDKSATNGDYQRFGEFARYGVVITRNKHLIKSAQSGQFVIEYSYTFDNAGKITSAAYRYNNQVFQHNYEYDCSQE